MIKVQYKQVCVSKMENPEEILHSLEEFSKLKPKDIPKELEEYLSFVAKTGDPVYQWGTVKSLFREKLINVITDFYESCPSVEIPPCPNVEVFNYESMKTFILEKLDTFAAAPFTVQRICELLTTPRKEYNRIDKYMRALEKNILVVSTTEPGNRRTTENGEGIVNGLESEHLPETNNSSNDINVEEMDDTPVWSCRTPDAVFTFQNTEPGQPPQLFVSDPRITSCDSVITCRLAEEELPYVSIEPVASDSCIKEENAQESDVTVTITAIPAAVQKRRDSIEPVVSSAEESTDKPADFDSHEIKENPGLPSSSSLSVTSSKDSAEDNEPTQEETSLNEDTTATTTTTSPASSSTNSEEQAEICESSTVVKELVESTESEPPQMQIPIISEITSGESVQDVEDIKEAETVNPPSEDSSNSEDDVTIKETTKTDSEETPEISTTVTSINEAVDLQATVCENPIIDTKETSVSSTDDSSNDAADIEPKSDSIDPTDDESRSYDPNIPQGDSSTDCASNPSPDLDAEETRDKQPDEGTLNDQQCTSSSTSQDSMDVDIGEESCQEPPTSDG